jgi:hypothetical protein
VGITIVLVAWWAISGGLDEMQTAETEQIVVVED